LGSRRDRLRGALRHGLLRAQRLAGPRKAIRGACRTGVRRAGRRLGDLPGVEAVYIRHSHPALDSFVVGASDLDATLVLDGAASDAPDVLIPIVAEAERLARLHFYLEARDLRFTTRVELTGAGRAAPFELLYRVDDWTLLAGNDVRQVREPEFPAALVPWHPEFGKWWHHILQDHLFDMPMRGRAYLRPIFRDVVKQKLQLLAAAGRGGGRPPGLLSDQDFVGAFEGDPETMAVLERLRRSHFWDDDPARSSQVLVLRILRDAAELLRSLAPHEPGTALRPVERGAIAYPVPYCQPDRYQLDLLLPDDLSLVGLRKAVDALRGTFGGRRARIGALSFTASLMLEGTLAHPLAYRGLPFPLLRDHLQRYARVLCGDLPPALVGAPGREDLQRACRVFLPYHMFNLRRRVEHSSAGLNFCQLAAIRLLLETDELETNAPSVQRLHREACARSPTEKIWDYLMQDAPDPHDPRYAAATRAVAAEYTRVQALLDPEPAR
jgi:hypothetical protein